MIQKKETNADSLTRYPFFMERFFVAATDAFFARWPRSLPSKRSLYNCKIISHRGDHDNVTVMENSLEAFDQIKDAGIWGIELDLRWTQDLVPVVFHDCSLDRLFGLPDRISELKISRLRAITPLIPTLEEVVYRFGKTLHLMIEVKEEIYPDLAYQNRVLKGIFRDLNPSEHFHLLSLTPKMFGKFNFVDKKVFLPIAPTDVGKISKLSLNWGWGGINGHYFFVKNARIREHHKRGQLIGTGFVDSKKCFCREINRGVDWIFSNNAINLQKDRNEMLKLYS